MSTHKYFDRICILVLVITLVVTVLFMNGKSLGLEAIVDEDAESYEGDANFTKNDYNGTWEKEDACTILLNDGSAAISGSGAYFYDNRLVIAAGGYYEVSGSLDPGQIIIDAYESSKVFLKLSGVSLSCPDDAAIRIEQADKVFLTLADGSENTLTSGETFTDEALADGTGGTIFSHDDLTINGSGSLTITASYKHGIDANDDLVITGGDISVTAPEDGFHVNDAYKFTGADLVINAGDDAIHSDKSILIAGGSLLINECYEGLEALTIDVTDGTIEIHPSDDGFNANGGSGDFFGGFGGNPQGAAETVSAETAAEVTTEAAALEMKAADATAMEMKAAETTAAETDTAETEEETWIHISGGEITVLNNTGTDADGIDSNGDILISGGTILVSLNGNGANNAIDYASENGGLLEITGGTVIACGGSSMVEAASDTSTQCTVLYNLEECTEDNTSVSLLDASGTELCSWKVPYGFTSLNLSCPGIESGNTYQIVIGDAATDVTFDTTSVTLGTVSMGMGGMQGGHGGRMQDESSTEGGFTPPMQSSEMSTEGGFMRTEMSTEGGMTRPDGSTEFGHHGGFGGPMEQTENETDTAVVSTGTPVTELPAEVLIWTAVSVIILIPAIILIKLYRRRK